MIVEANVEPVEAARIIGRMLARGFYVEVREREGRFWIAAHPAHAEDVARRLAAGLSWV